MKTLSEMIWDGSKKRPPTTEGWVNKNPDTGQIHTCAIAAAMDDAGLVGDDGGFIFGPGCQIIEEGWVLDRATGKYTGEKKKSFFPPLWLCRMMNVPVTPPCGCDLGRPTFFETIPHLHDAHGWTREATAMWVESVEKETTKYKDVLCPGWGGRPTVVAEMKVPALV